MVMKQKIELIVFFWLWGVVVMAHPKPYVEIEITPSMEKSGNIVVNITHLKQTDYNRLILLTLPMELTPCLPVSNGNSQNINGCWYIDRNNKTQLWIGNILQAGKTDLQMQIILPDMMRNSDNVNHSYKLNICTNYSDGLHKFLSLAQNDSTEIVFVNKIIFKGNKKYPVLETEPDNEWKKKDENERIYIIPFQNQEASTYLIFGVPNVENTIKFISLMIVSFIFCLFAGLGLYRYPKEAQKKVFTAIGAVVVVALFIVVFHLSFENLELDGKVVFERIVPILGYIVGVFIAYGTNKEK